MLESFLSDTREIVRQSFGIEAFKQADAIDLPGKITIPKRLAQTGSLILSCAFPSASRLLREGIYDRFSHFLGIQIDIVGWEWTLQYMPRLLHTEDIPTLVTAGIFTKAIANVISNIPISMDLVQRD